MGAIAQNEPPEAKTIGAIARNESPGAKTMGAEAAIPYARAATLAHSLGMGVNAGHDLDLNNLRDFANHVPHLSEVSIGHALISDALYLGMSNTVAKYLACLR